MIKRWKFKSDVEKMNTLWFWFRIFIIISVLNGVMDLIKNYFILNKL